MGNHSFLSLTLFIIFFPFSLNADCTYSNCAINMYPPHQISYPFRAYDQPLTCGLPGFDLACNLSSRTPLLTFPSGQSFTIEYIYQGTLVKYITITDPERCLAEKLVHLNTSGTPFYFNKFTYFTLYKCPSSFEFPSYVNKNSYRSCGAIDCARGLTYSVLCVNQSSSFSACELIGDVKFPDSSWIYSDDQFLPSRVDLGWKLPASCDKCLGGCYRNPNNLTKTKCKTIPGVIIIVRILVVIGIIAVLVTVSCLIRNLRNASTEQDELDLATSQQPSPRATITQDILDSYPVRVVGESGRMLANMDEKSCPICLADYAPKDTFKTLPECLHFFHAECIDEWLRANPTCPVCRTRTPLTFS